MPELNLDFGDGVVKTPSVGVTPPAETPDITGNNPKPDTVDITGKSGDTGTPPTTPPTTPPAGEPTTPPATETNNNSGNASTGELEAGTIINYEGVDYTVAENGDIVDKDGNVFKAAADVKAWLEENEQADDSTLDGTSINDIIEAVGIEVKDENGNNIEFANDKEGLKSYFDSVIQLKVNEANDARMNKFYQDNPIVKQFVDYLTVNNGDYRGFGQIPDRSGIVVDKDNEHQQEQIIRVAAAEFGNKAVSDAYIKYLKDSGGLYEEAVNQLQALVDSDKQRISNIEANAAAMRKAEEESVRAYWENVNNVIASRTIAGYKIPESFVKEVNGQKVTLTPDDFYDYLYKAREVDADGNNITGYQRDLSKLTNEELLNKELLDAYLMFTGGSYKDLVNMAVKEHEVRKLIIKSKEQRNNRTIRINKPKDKVDVTSIVYE